MLPNKWNNVTYVNNLVTVSPGPRNAIIWTNVLILLIGPLGTKLIKNINQNAYILIQENAIENMFYKMAANLSRPQRAE